jgi:hypothetical protein
MKETPEYIRQLLLPSTRAKRGRRVWSIDLETVWLPFFTATNVMGDTAIPLEALGAPLRLAHSKDGSVKFSASGRPVIRVAKEISQNVALVRENFTAHLQQYAELVATDKEKDFNRAVMSAEKVGKPIMAKDNADLTEAVRERMEAELKEATETPAPAGEPEKEREAVTA